MPASNDQLNLVQRHLRENLLTCDRHNVHVQVDRMNGDRTVAFCSVEQATHGLFLREREVSELVRQAEQALAPLLGLGIVPMIMPRHARLGNTARQTNHHRSTWRRLRAWLGLMAKAPAYGADDPFGWQLAMHHDR